MTGQRSFRFGVSASAPRRYKPRAGALPAAIVAGEAASQSAIDHAESERDAFSADAAAYFLAYLAAHGPTTAEDLTEAALFSGIYAADARAFGNVYRTLQRRGQIEVIATGLPRRRGHGAMGGKLWTIRTRTA